MASPGTGVMNRKTTFSEQGKTLFKALIQGWSSWHNITMVDILSIILGKL
jgi:hypothetical protein